MKNNGLSSEIKLFNKLNAASTLSSNATVNNQFRKIVQFTKLLDDSYYSQILNSLKSPSIQFSLYYNKTDDTQGKDLIKQFQKYYRQSHPRCSDEEMTNITNLFSLKVLLDDLETLGFVLKETKNIDDAYMFVGGEEYFENINYMIAYLEHGRVKKNAETTGLLSFLDTNNKYKIYFCDDAVDEIMQLNDKVRRSLLTRISKLLANEDFVPNAETIRHVKDSHGDFPLLRIWIGDDHRLAYLREGKVTAIVGVTMKSGKDQDYKRYDVASRKRHQIYKNIELFENGQLPENSKHNQLVSYLVNKYSSQVEGE